MRVTSAKTRQHIFVVDEVIEEGITPDRIALFLPDGTPIDLTADPSKMKWIGDWSPATPYILNDVVRDDESLYIAVVDSIAAGGSAPSTPNADWQLVFQAPAGGGHKGAWDIGTDYPPGSIVTYAGKSYGTPVDIASGGSTPAFDPNSNFGAPIKGVQVKASNKLDNAVPVVIDFANAVLDSGSKYAIPLALDFTGALWSDITLRVQNDTDSMLQLFIDDAATGGAGTAGGTANSGVQTDIAVNVDGWAGTSGQYVLLLNDFGGGAKPVGTVTLTVLAGANDLIPAPTANPWVRLAPDELPVGGAIGQVLAKKTVGDGDVEWVSREIPAVDTRANRLAATPTLGRLWKESDTGVVYRGNGAGWDIYNPVGQLVKVGDFTLPQSDTVLDAANNVPNFSWPLGAAEIWVVEALLRLQGVSSAADIKFDFSLPAGATFEIQRGGDAVGVASGSSPVAVATSSVDLGLINGIIVARLVAFITVSGTAGTAQLRAAQVTSTAEDVKLLRNSILLPRRIA